MDNYKQRRRRYHSGLAKYTFSTVQVLVCIRFDNRWNGRKRGTNMSASLLLGLGTYLLLLLPTTFITLYQGQIKKGFLIFTIHVITLSVSVFKVSLKIDCH